MNLKQRINIAFTILTFITLICAIWFFIYLIRYTEAVIKNPCKICADKGFTCIKMDIDGVSDNPMNPQGLIAINKSGG